MSGRDYCRYCAAECNDWFELSENFGHIYRTAANATYPTAQPGYAVAPAATASPYGTQRAGYDQAYQAAATQGTYASKYDRLFFFAIAFSVVFPSFFLSSSLFVIVFLLAEFHCD